MKKCFKCGKEIDIIAKNPNDVIYCKTCSQELLETMNLKKDRLSNKSTFNNRYIFYFFPGIFQLKEGNIISFLRYIFSTYFLTIIWFLLFYFEYKYGYSDKRINGLNTVFSLFIIVNLLLSYMNNYFDLNKEDY